MLRTWLIADRSSPAIGNRIRWFAGHVSVVEIDAFFVPLGKWGRDKATTNLAVLKQYLLRLHYSCNQSGFTLGIASSNVINQGLA